MNIEKRWVKMISMAALLLIVVSACDSDEDVESGDEGLYPGRIVDVNLQLDPLWIYEYTNRVREKVNICTGNDDNNTPGWQPGDEVIVNCTLMGESREDFIDYQFATYAVYTETKGGVYKWKLDSKRQLCVKRTVASHGVGGDIPAYDFELKMFIILPVRKFPINGDLILGLLYVKTRMQLEIMADGGLPWQTMKLERI